MNNNKNGRAILLMLLSMVAFSLADALVKLSTSSMSSLQVMFLLIAGGVVSFALIALLQGESVFDRRAFSPILLFRYAAETVGMIAMITALAKAPISSVGAITQATPLVAAAGAVLFLNEKVGWRRWMAIVVGFLGVLLIVQPGTDDFEVSLLWALLALIALSARDLNTRMVPKDMPSISLASFTLISMLPVVVALLFLNGEPLLIKNPNWLIILPMTILGSAGYLFLITSIRMAEVSVVLPFRYARIIFLMIIGVLVFDEKPNALMLLGATLIIASSVYIIWREQRVKKRSLANSIK